MLNKAEQKFQEHLEKLWESTIRPLLVPRNGKLHVLLANIPNFSASPATYTKTLEYYIFGMQQIGYEIVDIKPISPNGTFYQILYK